MEEFYRYVYANVFLMSIVVISISIAGTFLARRGNIRLARRVAIVAIGANVVIALIFFMSYVFVQYSQDLLFGLLWGALAYWNYDRFLRR